MQGPLHPGLSAFLFTDTHLEEVTVVTSYGPVKGRSEAKGKPILFKGIPFAAPITGENVLLPPQRRQPWHGKRDDVGLSFGQAAWQDEMGSATLFGVEASDPASDRSLVFGSIGDDCLNLNICTPRVPGGSAGGGGGGGGGAPVVCWIHGGANKMGRCVADDHLHVSLCFDSCC